MNPDKPSRDEIEAKLTALLLGELPEEEARLLRYTISQDPALAKLHDRLKRHHRPRASCQRQPHGNRTAETFR